MAASVIGSSPSVASATGATSDSRWTPVYQGLSDENREALLALLTEGGVLYELFSALPQDNDDVPALMYASWREIMGELCRRVTTSSYVGEKPKAFTDFDVHLHEWMMAAIPNFLDAVSALDQLESWDKEDDGDNKAIRSGLLDLPPSKENGPRKFDTERVKSRTPGPKGRPVYEERKIRNSDKTLWEAQTKDLLVSLLVRIKRFTQFCRIITTEAAPERDARGRMIRTGEKVEFVEWQSPKFVTRKNREGEKYKAFHLGTPVTDDSPAVVDAVKEVNTFRYNIGTLLSRRVWSEKVIPSCKEANKGSGTDKGWRGAGRKVSDRAPIALVPGSPFTVSKNKKGDLRVMPMSDAFYRRLMAEGFTFKWSLASTVDEGISIAEMLSDHRGEKIELFNLRKDRDGRPMSVPKSQTEWLDGMKEKGYTVNFAWLISTEEMPLIARHLSTLRGGDEKLDAYLAWVDAGYPEIPVPDHKDAPEPASSSGGGAAASASSSSRKGNRFREIADSDSDDAETGDVEDADASGVGSGDGKTSTTGMPAPKAA